MRPGRIIRSGASALIAMTALGDCGRPSATDRSTIVSVVASANSGPAAEAEADLVVIGDSLTDEARSATERRLAQLPLRSARIDAEWGRSLSAPGFGTRTGLEAIGDEGRAGNPEIWVIALGTNDAAYAPPDQWRVDITAALNAIEPGDRIVWITPAVSSSLAATQTQRAATDRFIALLEASAAADPRVTIVDWRATADTSGTLAADGIHLTDAGIAARAGLVAEAVRAVLSEADSAG